MENLKFHSKNYHNISKHFENKHQDLMQDLILAQWTRSGALRNLHFA